MKLYLTTSEEEEEDVYDCDDDNFLFFNISVRFMYQYNKSSQNLIHRNHNL